jgi:anti-sigma B factor antagonist
VTPPLARVRVDWRGDVPVAAIDGEVDASNAGEVGADLRSLLTNRSTDLVVDLTPTRYLDSAGINLLFSLGEELRARQLRLLLVIAPGSPVSRMLVLTGLDRTHATFACVDEATPAPPP